ncbi:MAG: M1 family metallopeptidase [Bacteroidetes bacterium]|nr:M1 family metallopeptidase [Bacteroidota bacterium]
MQETRGTGRSTCPLQLSRYILTLFFLLLVIAGTRGHAQDFGRRERSFDVLHYRIDVRLDEEARRVDGEVDISLTPLRSVIDSVVLDAVNMEIQSVQYSTSPWKDAETLRWNYDSTHLRMKLPESLRHGDTALLHIRYACRPLRGLYFVGPGTSYPDDPRQIWTQGQGEDNRHWFPSYDYPNDKATSEVLITIDTVLQTLSNGALRARHVNDDGTATWHWAQGRPHSSYLIMLAAGRYGVFTQEWNGIPVDSWHYLSDDSADIRRTFADTKDMMAFFSEYTGLHYPWEKYVQVPVRHFLYGGMENTSATVMADTRLVVDARAALDYDPQPLIAHELAHQWFGNYVTYIDWENEWLNEGFATYFQQLWTRHRFGEDDYIIQRYNGIRNYLDWADRQGLIPVVGERRGGAVNTYSKGAAVLHMLRDILGEEEFVRVIRTWLRRYAFANAETNDFKRVIEDVTGRSMQWFFRQWLYGAGYPVITVTREITVDGDSMHVTFRQIQQVDSLRGYFRMPLTLRWQSGDETCVWIDGAEQQVRFALNGGRGRFFEIDPSNLLCARIHPGYSREEWLRLLHTARSPAQRILAVEALFPFIGQQEIRRVLFDVAERDAHRDVRMRAATLLAELRPDTLSTSGEFQSCFIRLTSDVSSRVRATALNGLYHYRDPELLPLYHSMLQDSSYYVEAAAMNAILHSDAVLDTRLLRRRLEGDSHEDVLALAAMDWVRRHGLDEFIPVLRMRAMPGNNVRLRARAFETLLHLSDSATVLLKMAAAWLEEDRPEVRSFAVRALRLFDTQEVRNIMQRHAAREEDERVRALIRRLYRL